MLRGLACALLTVTFVGCTSKPDTDLRQDSRNQLVSGLPGAVTITDAGYYTVVGGIALSWTTAGNANGYRIYRTVAAFALPAPAVAQLQPSGTNALGELIGETSQTSFTDRLVASSHQYTYSVVAFNKAGSGPPSRPFTVKIPQPGYWYAHWVKAPQGNQPQDNVQYSIPVTTSGDAGIASVSTFPAAVSIGSCAAEGVAVESIRPAEESALAFTDQTFSITYVYNVTQTTWLGVNALALLDWSNVPIFDAFSHVQPGCGKTTYSFTADLSVMSRAATPWIILSAADRARRYWFAGRPSLRISKTLPAEGGTLDGSGPLQVELAYSNMPTTTVNLELHIQPMSQTAVTTVSGSAKVTVSVPYRLVCDMGSYGSLLVNANSIDDGTVFSVAHRQTPFEVVAPIELLASRSIGARFFLRVAACGGQSATTGVTVSTSLGTFSLSPELSVTRNPISGTVSDWYQLTVSPEEMRPFSYADIPVTVSASIGGSVTSTTLTLHPFDLFWSQPPPAIAEGLVTYPLSITAVNHPNWIPLYLTFGDYYSHTQVKMAWNGSSYAFPASFQTCGYYDFYVEGLQPLYTNVISSLKNGLRVGDRVTIRNPVSPISMSITNPCGKRLTWRIIEAPVWLRFLSLEGTTDQYLWFVADTESPPTLPASGRIVIEPVEGGERSIIDVNYLP